jgi:hypothetical protein
MTKRVRRPLSRARRELVERYLPMANALSKPLREAWPNQRDEYLSAAHLGLVEAAESWSPRRGVKFATFARRRILGALKDCQREQLPWGYRYAHREAEPPPVPAVRTAAPDSLDRTRHAPTPFDGLAAREDLDQWLRGLPLDDADAAACRAVAEGFESPDRHAEALARVARRLGAPWPTDDGTNPDKPSRKPPDAGTAAQGRRLG